MKTKKADKKVEILKTLTASEAKVGEKYLTEKGVPVVIVSTNGHEVVVTSASTGNKISLPKSYALKVYDRTKVSRDSAVLIGTKEGPVHADPKVIAERIKDVGGKRVLKREFKGKTHEVHVRDDGFVYNEKQFRSLSAIAKLITGAKKKNGPRFFNVGEWAA